MKPFNELARTPEYWLTNAQSNLYSAALNFAVSQNWRTTHFAKQLSEYLGIGRVAAAKIIDGDFDGTLTELIEYSLKLGVGPEIMFKPLDKYIAEYTSEQVAYDRIVQTERGWQGHFLCPCTFHLNTLLDLDGFKIVVSTVGAYLPPHGFQPRGKRYETIGHNRFYETLAFESKYDSYDDANVMRYVLIDSDQCYSSESDKEPQAGHWVVVEEIKRRMANGSLNATYFDPAEDEN
jgi:hypothetical protein